MSITYNCNNTTNEKTFNFEVTESTTSDEGRHLVPTDVDLNEKVLHNNINNISNNINNNSDEDDYFGYGIDSQADEVDSPGSFHDIFMA